MSWSEVGLHGTCQSAADNIIASNFRPGEGRRGNGVYFWFESDGGKALSEEWWKYRHSTRGYASELNSKLAIIRSDIVVTNQDDVLNLENPKINGMIAKRIKCTTKPHQTGAIYETVVQQLEAARKRSYHVVTAKVDVPDRENTSYPVKTGHKPFCMLIRHIACITTKQLIL